MADPTFTLRLVTPQRLLFEGPVTSIQAPGSEGYMGILAHHAALITTLRPGKLEIRDPGGSVARYAVSGGFLEVSENRATILADAVEVISGIDRDRAERALRRAEARLKDGGPIDRARAERARDRAKNRLSLAQR
jgi:F-type H+-transporting ATPase subunit epsilon